MLVVIGGVVAASVVRDIQAFDDDYLRFYAISCGDSLDGTITYFDVGLDQLVEQKADEIDIAWLTWLESRGGEACHRFAQIVRDLTSGTVSSVNHHYHAGLLRREIVGLRGRLACGFVVAGLFLALPSAYYAWRVRHRYAHGLCIRCGYSLRELAERRCPECGKTF